MSKGVLILAFGHRNFGKMALNLALSIKTTTPDMPIHIIYDSTTFEFLKQHLPRFFDSSQLIDPSEYKIDDKNQWGYIKTKMYDLSPYDTTIYIDADCFVVPNRNLHEIPSVPEGKIVSICYDQEDVCLYPDRGSYKWCTNDTLNKLKEVFPFAHNRYYNLQTSVMVFNKNDITKAFFDKAKEICIYMAKTGIHSDGLTWYDNIVPDELVFAVTNIHMGHDINLMRILSTPYTKISMSEVMSNVVVAFAVGSGTLPAPAKRLYNNYAAFFSSRYRINSYYWVDKKDFKRLNRINVR